MVELRNANPLAAYMGGLDMGQRQEAVNFLRQHGAAAAGGDKAALNALMSNPYTMDRALDMQNRAADMAYRDEMLGMRRAEHEAQLAQWKKQASASEKAQAAAELESAVKIMSGVQDPETWDRLAVQYGQENLVGQFDNRNAVMRQFMSFADIIRMDAGQAPGNDYERYAARERAAGREPLDEFGYRDKLRGPGGPMSAPGKVQADINSGYLPSGTPLRGEGVTVKNQSAPQVGSIPQGYELFETPEGAWQMRAIPGGPADAEAKAAEVADERKTERQNKELMVARDEIARITHLVENDTEIPFFGSTTTGLAGAVMGHIPSSDAGAVKGMLNTLKAYTAYDKLQAIRDASPTGGAVGQVSNFETRLMSAIYGELENARSKEHFLYNMNRLDGVLQRIADEAIPDDEARRMISEIETGDDDVLGLFK